MYNFERKENKLTSLGIGQRTLIEKWLDEMEIRDYIINDDLTIDVNNDVDLSFRNLIELPEYIQFNIVKGYFSFNYNKLISLRGCPKKVIIAFVCSNNELITLEGCPKQVDGSFWCKNNKVKFTKKYVISLCDVKGDIYC